MSLFALTNGFVSTQCAIKAPSMVSDDLKGSIGQSIGFSLSLGIMLGSILCIPMAKISSWHINCTNKIIKLSYNLLIF